MTEPLLQWAAMAKCSSHLVCGFLEHPGDPSAAVVGAAEPWSAWQEGQALVAPSPRFAAARPVTWATTHCCPHRDGQPQPQAIVTTSDHQQRAASLTDCQMICCFVFSPAFRVTSCVGVHASVGGGTSLPGSLACGPALCWHLSTCPSTRACVPFSGC